MPTLLITVVLDTDILAAKGNVRNILNKFFSIGAS